MDIVKSYIDWLHENISQNILSDNLIEITTPFLDRHNDYTQIYAHFEDGKPVSLSDYGYIIDDLRMSGFEFSTPKRKSMLETIINRTGVSISSDDHLFVKVSNLSEIPNAKHRLLQAMLAVNDMFNLNATSVKSLFFEDVKSFFISNEIFYTPNVNLTGLSKLSSTFDFVLQRNKNNPERLVRLMNSPEITASKQIIFSWNDVVDVREPNSKCIVILNDRNKKPSDEIIEAFKSYGISPILWSLREKHLKEFA